LEPGGSSALQADAAGDARGSLATDWQRDRASASQVASGTGSIVGGGFSNEASGVYDTVAGGVSNATASSTRATISGGNNNQITSSDNSVVAGGTNCTVTSSAQGTIGGGTTNLVDTSANSTIAGGSTNTIDTSLASAVVGGFGNSIDTADYCVAGGLSNTIGASCDYSTVFGRSNTLSTTASYGFVAGRENESDQPYTAVTGWGANVDNQGQRSHAAGSFAAAGDAQEIYIYQRLATTNATPSPMFIDGSSLAITMPDNASWMCDILLTAMRDDGTEAAGYNISACIRKDGAANPAFVGTATVNNTYEDNAAWNANVAISGANPTINVVGATANINWFATWRIAQVIGS
jgi:hypothetical protein